MHPYQRLWIALVTEADLPWDSKLIWWHEIMRIILRRVQGPVTSWVEKHDTAGERQVTTVNGIKNCMHSTICLDPPTNLYHCRVLQYKLKEKKDLAGDNHPHQLEASLEHRVEIVVARCHLRHRGSKSCRSFHHRKYRRGATCMDRSCSGN